MALTAVEVRVAEVAPAVHKEGVVAHEARVAQEKGITVVPELRAVGRMTKQFSLVRFN